MAVFWEEAEGLLIDFGEEEELISLDNLEKYGADILKIRQEIDGFYFINEEIALSQLGAESAEKTMGFFKVTQELEGHIKIADEINYKLIDLPPNNSFSYIPQSVDILNKYVGHILSKLKEEENNVVSIYTPERLAEEIENHIRNRSPMAAIHAYIDWRVIQTAGEEPADHFRRNQTTVEDAIYSGNTALVKEILIGKALYIGYAHPDLGNEIVEDFIDFIRDYEIDQGLMHVQDLDNGPSL